MTFSLSLQWTHLIKPLIFHAQQFTLLMGGDEMAGLRVVACQSSGILSSLVLKELVCITIT